MIVAVAVTGAMLVAPPVAAETTGPVIVHVPVTTAAYGQDIPILATTTCPTGAACSARLYFRTTAPTAPVTIPTLVNPSGFQVVPLDGAPTTVDSQQALVWTGMIPGAATTTTGVDYFLEADVNGTRSVFPGTTYADGVQPTGTFVHIHVLSPPLINHVPVPVAIAGQPMGVDAQVSCSSGNCQATLHYRKTPATLDTGFGSWSSISMSGPGTSLGGVASLILYHAEVPASSVDTTGVDYWIHVTDGHTQAFSPGTPYQGWYAPTDGTHSTAASYHVHVLEPPRIVHAPLPAASYRQGIAVSGRTNCPSTRTCTATLYYRTTPPGILSEAAFSSTPMTVTRTVGPGLDAIVVDGLIEPGAVDTRGVDYFFSVTDGTTTSWWPGTSAADGPGVWVTGTRVVYHHVRVVEPPHLTHVPPTIAQPLTDLVIQAEMTCATENCSATLFYSSTPNTPGTYQAVTMSRSLASPPNPLTRAELWQGTIPAGAVTTRGLVYYMTATDGYTNTAAPGTFYWGAYAPVDGSNPAPEVARFVVRVVDPPHPVHVPPGTANASEDIPIEVRSNCATRNCNAMLHWRVTGQGWNSMSMPSSATPVPLAYGNELVTFKAAIPGANVTFDGVEYRIEIGDGYVTEMTPTVPVVVRKVANHAVGSVRFTGTADLPTFPCSQASPCTGSFAGEWLGELTGSLDDNPFEIAWRTLPGHVNINAGFSYYETTCAMPDGGAALGFASGTGHAHSGSEEAIGTFGSPTAGIPRVITAISFDFSFTWQRAATGAVLTLTPTSFTVEVAGLGPRTILTGTQRGVATFAAESASNTQAPTCATPLNDVHGAVAGNVEFVSQ
jgi:hypothetical protein